MGMAMMLNTTITHPQMIACEHNLFEEDGQAVANVLSLTVHENYGPFGYENDICLVEHDDVTGLE